MVGFELAGSIFGAGSQFAGPTTARHKWQGGGEATASGEVIVVLVVVGDRSVEALGKRDDFGNCAGEHDVCARENDGEPNCREQPRRFGDRFGAAAQTLELAAIADNSMSTTWVNMSRGMLNYAGSEMRLVRPMTPAVIKMAGTLGGKDLRLFVDVCLSGRAARKV